MTFDEFLRWAGHPPAPGRSKSAAQAAAIEDVKFTPVMVEAIHAAWHGAGVGISGGDWKRFVGMLPRA